MREDDLNMENVLNRIADGVATDEEKQRLQDWLRSGPEARKEYRNFMELHSALHWDYVATALPEPTAGPEPDATDSVAYARLTLLNRVVTFAACAAIAVLVWVLVSVDQPSDSKIDGNPQPVQSVAALLVNETGAVFADGLAPDGVQFNTGGYELLSGVVHLRFANGADVVMASPARLEIVDVKHMKLAYGKVRVTAPPSAKGFTISTSDVDYIDLGTEFGLNVDRKSGASDLYVFEGQVNIADTQSGEVSEYYDGQSSRYLGGVVSEAPKLAKNAFPTAGEIGLLRWQRYTEIMKEDTDLLTFLPFRRNDNPALLVNAVSSEKMSGGRIVGARWTSGRWPGKDALLFDRDTDFVELEIPGEYVELSMSVWLNVDRLDHTLNAILNSDGYEIGGIHFQLSRQGYPRGGLIVKEAYKEKVQHNKVPVGQWTNIVSVIRAKESIQQIYVNGVLARERKWNSATMKLRPGSCRLGNWLATPDQKERSLRGRIDELAVWKRALSEEEIMRLVEEGRPQLSVREFSVNESGK